MDTSPVPRFARDRFTWLAYLMLAYFAYQQATLGPLMPFLRDELRLSYTVGGLHLSAFALGMVLAGLMGDALVRRWGRRRVFWGGGAGMAAGSLLFVAGHHPALTIPSALLMGAPGTLLMIMVQAALSDRHGARRAVALTESNVGASLAAGLAPLLVGSLQRTGIGWRGALILGVLGWGTLALRSHAVTIPPHTARPSLSPATGRAARLPAVFWAYWLVVFLGVSVEWCVIFWGPDFLETSVGLRRVDASTLMSVFFAAHLLGRILGSRLSRRMPVGPLLLAAVSVAAAGFLLLAGERRPLNIAGLFVAGLGIANLFPLTLSAASDIVARASRRCQQPHHPGAGLAILITPQVLGTLADSVAIKNAFTVAAVFLVVAAGAILAANRRAGRSAVTSA